MRDIARRPDALIADNIGTCNASLERTERDKCMAAPLPTTEGAETAPDRSHDKIPQWTTTRCSRLLRPLRVALHAIQHPPVSTKLRACESAEEIDPLANRPQAFDSFDLPVGNRSELLQRNYDPDFLPRKVGSRKTYSKRTQARRKTNITVDSSTAAASSGLDRSYIFCDEVSLPLSQATGQPVTGSSLSEYRDLLAGLDLFRRKPHLFGTYRAVFTALNNVLKSTAEIKNIAPARSGIRRRSLSGASRNGASARSKGSISPSSQAYSIGASSLSTTCLKRVPQLVEAQQIVVNSAAESARYDVSKEIYEQLENFMSSSSVGWAPLRILCRYHGIFLLTETIKKGLITPKVIIYLAFICRDAACEDGHRYIMRAWCYALRQGHFKQQAHLLWQSLLSLSCSHLYWDLLVDELNSGNSIDSYLIDQEVWRQFITDILDADFPNCESAIALLERLIDISDDWTNQTLENASNSRDDDSGITPPHDRDIITSSPIYMRFLSASLASLSAVAIAHDSKSSLALVALQRTASAAQYVCIRENSGLLTVPNVLLAVLPLLSLVLVSSIQCGVDVDFTQACESLRTLIGKIDDAILEDWFVIALSRHISDTALCCGSEQLQISHEQLYRGARPYMRQMVEGTLDVSELYSCVHLAQAATMAAYDFAEHQSVKSNNHFAIRAETRTDMLRMKTQSSTRNIVQSVEFEPHPSPELSRYRWEQSISEWIKIPPPSEVRAVTVVIPPVSSTKHDISSTLPEPAEKDSNLTISPSSVTCQDRSETIPEVSSCNVVNESLDPRCRSLMVFITPSALRIRTQVLSSEVSLPISTANMPRRTGTETTRTKVQRRQSLPCTRRDGLNELSRSRINSRSTLRKSEPGIEKLSNSDGRKRRRLSTGPSGALFQSRYSLPTDLLQEEESEDELAL